MLQLKNIKKIYDSGDSRVTALAGVSIDFRESEFVSILGPSGCGKTTLLNIVGGLDRYSDGDLFINGRSTKGFKDADWDTYRNHSIGFVFQSYNLIPHQSVLRNVELALTLSGVSKSERRRRAVEALEKVGLGGQVHKRPNQLSGGQMQRVAIARAIVNDPDILLADEPTGALDTHTSVQIMEILKEIAKDKLVIMVTHNPELAEAYSTRIVKLRDGMVIDDSMPFTAPTESHEVVRKTTVKKGKRASMSFLTAMSLSLNNLMTKKGRTFMTSFAGSIGIIGIALILALSNGINNYIKLVQEDALSSYPLSIQAQSQDLSAMMGAMTSIGDEADYRDSGKVYVDDSMGSMMSAINTVQRNDLETFKKHVEAHYEELKPYLSSLQYTYDYDLQVFNIGKNKVGEDMLTQVNPTTILENMGDTFAGMTGLMDMSGMEITVMSEMIDNQELLDQQYEVVAGEWPDDPNELVLVISKNNQISKMTLYMLGVYDQSEIAEIMNSLIQDGDNYDDTPLAPIEYEDFLGMDLYLVNTSDYFVTKWAYDGYASAADVPVDRRNQYFYLDDQPIWVDKRTELDLSSDDKMAFVQENGTKLTISGIIRPAKGSTSTSISTNLAYTKGLTDRMLALNAENEILNQQKATPEYNVLTGLKFERSHFTPDNIGELLNKLDSSTKTAFYAVMKNMILSNPEYEGMVNIQTPDGFLGFYTMMPETQRMNVMTSVLNAVRQNGADTTGLFGVVSAMIAENLPGVTVTEGNFLGLLPSLPLESQLLALRGLSAEEATGAGIPFAVPGLIELAGEETMKNIYAFAAEEIKTIEVTDEIFAAIVGTLSADDPAFVELEQRLYSMAPGIDAAYATNLAEFGEADERKPATVNFYAKDFEAKEKIEAFIEDYNENIITYLDIYKPEWRGEITAGAETGVETGTLTDEELETLAEEYKIKYNDLIGLLLSSVTTIVNAISYVLIAFVSISLVVSSIMIGIITYISVLERTKEIGILRAMGASKRDVSRVFNAETLMIGLCAGLIGIIFTVLICIPISLVIQKLSGIPSLAAILPWKGAIALVTISMLLTVVAGLIPSRVAAKKDPVVALRTE